MKQIIPLLEQLTPIYLDIANGAEVGCSGATARCTCMHRGATALPAQTALMRVHAPLLWCRSHLDSRREPLFAAGVYAAARGEQGHHPARWGPRGTEVGGCSCAPCTLHICTAECHRQAALALCTILCLCPA